MKQTGQQERYLPEEAGYQVLEARYATAILQNLETGERELFVHTPRARGFVVQIQRRPFVFQTVLH